MYIKHDHLTPFNKEVINSKFNFFFINVLFCNKILIDRSSDLVHFSFQIIGYNPQNITYSAVCEPFLDVNIRYHRPIVALINSAKQTDFIVRRKIWLYNRGNYENFRSNIGNKEWDPLFDNQLSIDEITKNLTDTVLKLAADSIPNRIIAIRNNDLPWITSDIKQLMRKKKLIEKESKEIKLRVLL